MAAQDFGIDLKKLARLGAAARVVELEREIAALKKAFPELRTKAVEGQATPAATAKEPAKHVTSKRGRRKPMSATERKAVSERMKKFWAERRKQKD